MRALGNLDVVIALVLFELGAKDVAIFAASDKPVRHDFNLPTGGGTQMRSNMNQGLYTEILPRQGKIGVWKKRGGGGGGERKARPSIT